MPYPDDIAADAVLQPDHDAVLAAMQDQIDDLIAAMNAQQAAIDSLASRVRGLEQRAGRPSGA